MVFKYRSGVYNGHGNDGNACFLRNLKAALVEGEESILCFIPCALREDTDGDTVFGFFDGLQDRLKSGLDILTIQEETVQILHPDIQQGPFQHFFFGNVAGRSGNADVGQDHIEKAAVIAYIQYRGIGGNIFLADGDHFGTRQADDLTECPVDNGQGTAVLQVRVELADDLFHQHKRCGQDQK